MFRKVIFSGVPFPKRMPPTRAFTEVIVKSLFQSDVYRYLLNTGSQARTTHCAGRRPNLPAMGKRTDRPNQYLVKVGRLLNHCWRSPLMTVQTHFYKLGAWRWVQIPSALGSLQHFKNKSKIYWQAEKNKPWHLFLICQVYYSFINYHNQCKMVSSSSLP